MLRLMPCLRLTIILTDSSRFLSMEKEQGGLRIKLIFNNIHLNRKVTEEQESSYKLNSFDFKILVDYD